MIRKIKNKLILFLLLVPTITFGSDPLYNDLQKKGAVTELGSIQVLITSVANIVLSAAGAIAVVMIIVGGIRYISSAGNPDAAEGAKKTLTAAVIGLIIVTFSFVIVNLFAKLLGGNYQ